MNKGNMSRRGFLAHTLAGLTVGAGLPVWFAREIIAEQEQKDAKQRPLGPNDQIVLGAIGVGTNYTRRRQGAPVNGERGFQIMRDAMGRQGVRVVAVCDVDRHNREFARDAVNRQNRNNDCRMHEDFRELLRNRDINAVLIGTPDHWHATIAIAAMRAGKDVYCEKPLTLTLDEGKALVRVARATNRIVQTGSQQRTEFNGRFRLACELVRNNRIGRIARIETIIGSNPAGGPFEVRQVPDGLNWDFWLGQTPRVDYVPQRCHYEFRWWYEYSGGKMTDWGAHHNDTAQWALGMDSSGPVRIEPGRCEAPNTRANCYNCHPNFEVTYVYNNGPNNSEGTRVVCRSNRSRNAIPENNGVMFEGENNQWIFVSRGRLVASDGDAQNSRLLRDPLPQNATRLEVANSQMQNFLDCVRSRRQPICNAVVGHRSCSICHLGNIAIRTGRRLTWDPSQERFTGDHAEEANRMLTRPMRAPWDAYWREQVGNA